MNDISKVQLRYPEGIHFQMPHDIYHAVNMADATILLDIAARAKKVTHDYSNGKYEYHFADEQEPFVTQLTLADVVPVEPEPEPEPVPAAVPRAIVAPVKKLTHEPADDELF